MLSSGFLSLKEQSLQCCEVLVARCRLDLDIFLHLRSFIRSLIEHPAPLLAAHRALNQWIVEGECAALEGGIYFQITFCRPA